MCIHNLMLSYKTGVGRHDDDDSDGEDGDNDDDIENNDNETCLSDRRGSSTVHETRIAGTGGAATSSSHIHKNSFIFSHHSLFFVCKIRFFTSKHILKEPKTATFSHGKFSLGSFYPMPLASQS